MHSGLANRRRLPKRLALLAGLLLWVSSVPAAVLRVEPGVQLDLSNIFSTQLGMTLAGENGYDGLRAATEKYVALEVSAPSVATNGTPVLENRSESALRPERLIVDSRTYRVVGVLARSPVFPTPAAADAYFNRCLRAVLATQCQGRPMTRLVNGFAVRYPSPAGERIFTCERNTLDGTGRTQFALAVVDAQSGLAALRSARVQKTVQSRSTYFRQPQTKK